MGMVNIDNYLGEFFFSCITEQKNSMVASGRRMLKGDFFLKDGNYHSIFAC